MSRQAWMVRVWMTRERCEYMLWTLGSWWLSPNKVEGTRFPDRQAAEDSASIARKYLGAKQTVEVRMEQYA
jgi:hypothetical protein